MPSPSSMIRITASLPSTAGGLDVAPGGRELQRVGEQVPHHLLQAAWSADTIASGPWCTDSAICRAAAVGLTESTAASRTRRERDRLHLQAKRAADHA